MYIGLPNNLGELRGLGDLSSIREKWPLPRKSRINTEFNMLIS